MDNNKVIVHVDKTVVKVTGIEVKGLNINQLEEVIQEKLKSVIRIIGVTGNSVEMDVYGVEEEAILKDEDGFIKAIAIAEGITISDISKISSVEKIKTIDVENLPPYKEGSCLKERWLHL
ncbi:MAG: hypothetical protein ACRCW1_08800 [Anaerotignaceae bacterium]